MALLEASCALAGLDTLGGPYHWNHHQSHSCGHCLLHPGACESNVAAAPPPPPPLNCALWHVQSIHDVYGRTSKPDLG